MYIYIIVIFYINYNNLCFCYEILCNAGFFMVVKRLKNQVTCKYSR